MQLACLRKNAKKKKKAVLATKIRHAKNAKKKKSKKSIVHATKRSKRGIEPAPLAVECTDTESYSLNGCPAVHLIRTNRGK